MDDSERLQLALERYQNALQLLDQPTSSASPQAVLEVLVARDALQAMIADSTQIPATALIKLDKLDHQLRQQTKAIAQTDQLPNWRTLLNPPTTAWWWFPTDPQPQPWWDRLDALWNIATLSFMTASLALILNTSARFFVGGADAWGSLAIVAQSVLALITGGSLTAKGRELLEHTFTGMRIPKRYWQEMNAILSLALLLIILGFRATLPSIAARFNQNGLDDYQAGRLSSALSNYQQAIALRPDYTEAHYYLGVLYEDLQKIDQAIAEYELIVQSDSTAATSSQEHLILLQAHNNLGRLYLLKNSNQAAWIPLERGLRLVKADVTQNDANVQYEHYKLLKNMGWVRLQQQHYLDAQKWLQQAIALQPEIEHLLKEVGGHAAPFCLRAQVLEAQQQNAETDWIACTRYAELDNPDEAQWVGLARQRLANP